VGSIPITRSNRQPEAEVKRLLKFVGIVVGTLVVLLIIAALVLPLIVNPNHFKPQIERVVKEHTGRELSLAGKIHLSVFPSIGLRLGKTVLSNARGFGKRPFARVDAVDVSVALLPLLHKQIVIRKVELDGVELNLARDRHGRNNWEDMVQAAQRSSGSGKKVPARGTSPAAAAAALASFRIEDGIDIRDGTFRWEDARDRQSYVVDRLALSMGSIEPDQPMDMHLSFDLRSGKPVLRTTVDLRSRLTLVRSRPMPICTPTACWKDRWCAAPCRLPISVRRICSSSSVCTTRRSIPAPWGTPR
jgi:AsmA protein